MCQQETLSLLFMVFIIILLESSLVFFLAVVMSSINKLDLSWAAHIKSEISIKLACLSEKSTIKSSSLKSPFWHDVPVVTNSEHITLKVRANLWFLHLFTRRFHEETRGFWFICFWKEVELVCHANDCFQCSLCSLVCRDPNIAIDTWEFWNNNRETTAFLSDSFHVNVLEDKVTNVWWLGQ